jgi:hypothetical protein
LTKKTVAFQSQPPQTQSETYRPVEKQITEKSNQPLPTESHSKNNGFPTVNNKPVDPEKIQRNGGSADVFNTKGN